MWKAGASARQLGILMIDPKQTLTPGLRMRAIDWTPLIDRAEQLQQRLQLPERFLDDVLIDGDDWSFVIMTCALVETALTDHLLRTLDTPPLVGEISRLSLRTKTSWARKLGAINGDRENFIAQLGKIRNEIAHQIRHIATFSLFDRMRQLAPHEFRQLTGFERPTDADEIELLKDGVRYAIWFSAWHLIDDIENTHERTLKEREDAYQAAREADVAEMMRLVDHAIEETNAQMATRAGTEPAK